MSLSALVNQSPPSHTNGNGHSNGRRDSPPPFSRAPTDSYIPSRRPESRQYEYARSPSFSPPPQSRRRPSYPMSQHSPYGPPPLSSHTHHTPSAGPGSIGPSSSTLDYTPVIPNAGQIFYNTGPPPSYPYSRNQDHRSSRPMYDLPRSISPPPLPYPDRSRASSWDHPGPFNGLRSAHEVREVEPPRMVTYRLGDRLVGSEDIWEEVLKGYQMKREAEADMIAAYDPSMVSFSSIPQIMSWRRHL